MIKHHPTFELIQSFVKGDLPASLSAGIAIHADMCPVCQQKILQLTEQAAEISFEEAFLDRFNVEHQGEEIPLINFDQMIEGITQTNELELQDTIIEKSITFKNKTFKLPVILNSMPLGKTAQFGKLARAAFQLNENEIHTNLLHIEPGGGVPEHTHKGFELTVLLAGSFHDDNGQYVKGDFIMLDGTNTHQPISQNGCLCYTVANDALHFTQGLNKLLNPIGSFIY
jgi:putative transcriptional regulator